jgi:hypothetical protein
MQTASEQILASSTFVPSSTNMNMSSRLNNNNDLDDIDSNEDSDDLDDLMDSENKSSSKSAGQLGHGMQSSGSGLMMTSSDMINGSNGQGQGNNNFEDDKRKRRAIANSNERRRMQSINAGFQTLKSLIPHSSGEKLSKVRVFLCFFLIFLKKFFLGVLRLFFSCKIVSKL